jgi:hypothetical protein
MKTVSKEGAWHVTCMGKKKNTCRSVVGKGKAIPLQAWTGPEGSRRLKLPDF